MADDVLFLPFHVLNYSVKAESRVVSTRYYSCAVAHAGQETRGLTLSDGVFLSVKGTVQRDVRLKVVPIDRSLGSGN